MGVGTTPAVAKMLGRKYIGIEKEKTYFEVAEKRVENTKFIDIPLHRNVLDIKPPKSDIKDMIKKGYFKTGEYFYDKKNNKAKLTQKGHLNDGSQELSIHKMAAKLLNKINHNGWEYWFVERNKRLVPIDEIRKEYRKRELGYVKKAI
jgi:site-specific DNA-methyltransferase (adenine-specific)